MSKPATLHFRITGSDGAVATAAATLLWDKAPKTCAAIAAQLPMCSHAVHSRNSGDEALLITPALIDDVPQDASENATQAHAFGNVLFGFEPAGFCYGGAGDESASEIAWIYGHAAEACYWVSEKGPPHREPPYRRQTATLNHFAQIFEEDGFYAKSKALPKTGLQKIEVWGS